MTDTPAMTLDGVSYPVRHISFTMNPPLRALPQRLLGGNWAVDVSGSFTMAAGGLRLLYRALDRIERRSMSRRAYRRLRARRKAMRRAL